MSIGKPGNRIYVKYSHIPGNKFPHRVAFFTPSGGVDFDEDYITENVNPWVRDNVGKCNEDWKRGYPSEVCSIKTDQTYSWNPSIFIYKDRKVFGVAYYFKDEEAAMFFKLTWSV